MAIFVKLEETLVNPDRVEALVPIQPGVELGVSLQLSGGTLVHLYTLTVDDVFRKLFEEARPYVPAKD